MFEFFGDVFSEFHHIANIDITAQEGIADFLEAFFDCILVDDSGFVELLKGRGDLAT